MSEALRLADALDGLCIEPSLDIRSAAELRRLHAEVEALRNALRQAVGAVQALLKEQQP